MKINKKGIRHLKEVEGFRNHPYLDSAGVPTIGFGNTYYADGTRVTMNDKPISIEEANKLTMDVLVGFEADLNRLLTAKVDQNQYNALLSFIYNIGTPEFSTSTILRVVNENPNADEEIKREFRRWKFANGVEDKGVKNRREKEIKLYFK